MVHVCVIFFFLGDHFWASVLILVGCPLGVQVLGVLNKELNKLCRSNRPTIDLLKVTVKVTPHKVESKVDPASPHVWASHSALVLPPDGCKWRPCPICSHWLLYFHLIRIQYLWWELPSVIKLSLPFLNSYHSSTYFTLFLGHIILILLQ